MAKTHLAARIEQGIVERVERRAQSEGQSRTAVIEQLLREGLDRIEEREMAEGFALLGDPEMQDMAFPTGPQREAARLAQTH